MSKEISGRVISRVFHLRKTKRFKLRKNVMLRARLSSLDDCNLFSLNLRSFKVESFVCYYSFSKRFLIFFSPDFPPSLDVLYPVSCTFIDDSRVFVFSSRSFLLYLVYNHPLLYFPLLCFIFLLILVLCSSDTLPRVLLYYHNEHTLL